MAGAERLLELQGVTMAFGGLVVVSHLDLHVDEGEIVSVIGPNGAGKTTLFNLVTGVYEPVDGDIRFAGESIVGLDPHRITRKGIARTFQTLRLFLNMLGSSLDGKELLIVGPGRIGRETARLAEAFGARSAFAGRGADLQGLLPAADVVSLHVPLTDATRHLIDAEALSAMRQSAVLVNVARGPVVDERALVDALRDGVIAGAALDVYEREPEVEEGLLSLENVVLTPHLGSATRDTRVAMGMLCVDALRAVLLEGRRPANAVG